MKLPVPVWSIVAPTFFIYIWSLCWIFSRYFAYLPASYDSAYYLMVGKAFSQGMFFHNLASPDPLAGALLGPSFYPLLLSLYWYLPIPNLLVLKIAMALITGLAPVFAFIWLRIWVPSILAFILSLAFGSSYMFIVIGNSLMTECVYSPILYAGMWLAYHGIQNQNTAHQIVPRSEYQATGYIRNSIDIWLAMLLFVIEARTRVVGWVYMFTFIALALSSRRWKVIFTGLTLAGIWVGIENLLATGVKVTHYTDSIFTTNYPIKIDLWLGLSIWGSEIWRSLFAFSTSINAHILFPYLYDLLEMSKTKRVLCLSIFLWTAWGFGLAFLRWQKMQPWLLATLVTSIPTFFIFQANDSFRYHMPYFPFLAIFFLTPFLTMGDKFGGRWQKGLPLLVCLFLLSTQIRHAFAHDFDSEFQTEPREFNALHDSIAAMPHKPDICISPNHYYTYLKTGLASVRIISLSDLNYVQKLSQNREVWVICGPTNEHSCNLWSEKRMVFQSPRIKQVGSWRVYRVDAWPEKL